MSETTTKPAQRTAPRLRLRREDIFNGQLPFRLAYLYLAIPMYIFLFGWVKLPLALLTAVILTAGLLCACMHAPAMDTAIFRKTNLMKWCGVVILAVLWVYTAGIGKYAFQNFDHMWRNAILDQLVNDPWPVVVTDPDRYGEHFDGPVAMIYYFAIWMPAALAGKLWGLDAAYRVLFIWCVIGVVLVFTMLMGLQKRISPWIAVAFIFFSGMDTVGDFIMNNAPNFLWFANHHIEYWISGFQFSALSTQLFWVFNQAIPAWLITLLLLHQKDNRSVIFIYSFSFLACTLPAIGMLPILAYIGIRRITELWDGKRKLPENLRTVAADVLTIENVITGLTLTLLSYLFLKVNATGTSGFRLTELEGKTMCYLLFVMLEFVVYYIAIYKTQGGKVIYWVSLVTLLVCPMISCGSHCDFMMRASIPGLIVLFTLIMDAYECLQRDNARKSALLLTALMVLGGFTAYHEISRSVINTIRHASNPDIQVVATQINLLEEGSRSNFFGEYEDSVFFRYIAKK